MLRTKVVSVFCMTLLGATLHANSEDFAVSLMKLRADVEKLDSAIVEEKESYKSSIKSLLRQKDELTALLSKEDLKIKQLNQELEKVKKEIHENSKNSEGLKPLLLPALDQLVITIKESIPFKINERTEDVLKIKEQLESNLITPQKALVLTWNAYGDLLRMTKENGLFKQTVSVGGEEKLAEVIRIGTVMMFYKTPSDQVGYVTQENGVYGYKEITSKEEKEQILVLFDAFKKQIRTGYFTLPNALISMEKK